MDRNGVFKNLFRIHESMWAWDLGSMQWFLDVELQRNITYVLWNNDCLIFPRQVLDFFVGFLVLCFPVSLIFCFSAFCFSRLFAFLLLCFPCFPAFPASLLFCFLLFLLLCFFAFLLFAFPASLLFCFSVFLASLLLYFCAFLLLLFYFFFSSVMCFCCSTSCCFASLLPVFTVSLFFIFFCFILFCLYPKWNPRENLGETQNPKTP